MTAIAVLTVYNCLYVEPETPRTRLDGDTFRCQGKIDPLVPDSRTWIPKVRLVRVNAPETGDQGAEEARSALIAWLSRKAFDLHCVARDKYGRLLADAEGDDGLLSDYMWRPRWYAVHYKNQFKERYDNPIDAPVKAANEQEKFPNSFVAACRYGLLEREVVLSIANRTPAWPTYQYFELVEMT